MGKTAPPGKSDEASFASVNSRLTHREMELALEEHGPGKKGAGRKEDRGMSNRGR